MKISYSGGLRDDCTGIHSFIFMKRKGQPTEVTFVQNPSYVQSSFWLYLLNLLCQPLLSDVPSNVKIDCFGPAADGVALHHEDVIALCKRYCSDQELCQDQFSKSKVGAL